MAVVFYVDPKLAEDSEQDGTQHITLSYTFYPVREPEPPVADSAPTLPTPRAVADRMRVNPVTSDRGRQERRGLRQSRRGKTKWRDDDG